MTYTFNYRLYRIFFIGFIALAPSTVAAQNTLTANEILDKIDKNMVSSTVYYSAQMIIHQRNRINAKEMRVWSEGKKNAFVEFLSPARDKGTKYLRLDESLWMFLPSIEKTIKISGHLLRQSMMGSDFSYEDSLDRIRLQEDYTATIIGEELLNNRLCYVLDLIAAKKEVTYYRRKMWIDKEQFIGLKTELYAHTRKLLKVMTANTIERVQNRYYPVHVEMRDQLRKNTYTEFIITEIEFDVDIPGSIFSLRNLERR